MADKSSMPMGRRQQARAQQRKRRRAILIFALIIFLSLVIFLVWMKQYNRTQSGADQVGETISAALQEEGVTTETDGLAGTTDLPETEETASTEPIVVITDYPESAEPTDEAEPEETPAATDSGTDSEDSTKKDSAIKDNSAKDTSSKDNSSKNNSSKDKTGTGNNTSNKNKNNSSNNKNTSNKNTSNQNTSNQTSTGTNTGNKVTVTTSPSPSPSTSPTTTTSPSPSPSVTPSASPDVTPETSPEPSQPVVTITLKSATLSASVLAVNQGDKAELSWVAYDTEGNDITDQCAIAYQTKGCAVEGNTLIFNTAGQAEVTGTVTYQGTAVETNTVTIQVRPVIVAKPALDSVALSCSVTTAKVGDTGVLTVTALDEEGNDISAACVVSYSESELASVEGDTIAFQAPGTVSLTATVTYEGKSITTQAITVAVVGPLAQVALTYDGEETVALGSTATLTAVAKDESGAVLSDATITYTITNALCSKGTLTFTKPGTVTITASATLDEVTVTSEPITIQVSDQVAVGAESVSLSQSVSDSRYGWSGYLPKDAKEEKADTTDTAEEGDSTKTYVYASPEKSWSVSFTLSAADRATDDTATVAELLEAAEKALTDQGIKATGESTKTYYQLTWTEEDVITVQRVYVGEKATNTISISYPKAQEKDLAKLQDTVLAIYQPGTLNKTHPAKSGT